MTTDLVMTSLRVLLGLIFVAHGSQKLFGWFGGYGIAGTGDFLASLGLRPARPLAWLVALAESLAGIALVIGLGTPVAAAVISGVMIAAITLVHWSHGLWAQQGGIEYPLVLLVLSAAVGLAGPGAYAVDSAYGITVPVPEAYAYTLAAAVLVILAAAVAGRIGARKQPAAIS